MYNIEDMNESAESIETMKGFINESNYKSVFNDFITLYAVNDYLTDILYKLNIYHAIDLFSNEEVDGIQSYNGFHRYKDDTEQWYKVDTKNKTITELNINDMLIVMNQLKSVY